MLRVGVRFRPPGCKAKRRWLKANMGLINQNPPKRPKCWTFSSIAELFRLYEKLFLAEGGKIASRCGHKVHIFDHHFFHMAGVCTSPEKRLYMPNEKEEILSTVSGFGKYIVNHSGTRARDLPSAFATLQSPDEVWINNPIASTATWVYIKEFDSRPYGFTVALLAARPAEGKIIVPVSSFCCKKNRVKVWRKMDRIFP